MHIDTYGLRSKTSTAMGLLSIGLCFVPLFNLLGFEFCLAAAGGLTLCHGIESAWKLHASPADTIERWRLSCLSLVGPIVALLAPILINGFFVTNCNWMEGFRLFILMVVLGGVISAGFAAACASLGRRAPWIFLACWLVALGFGFARFFLHPQVDIFTLFIGYFPGALYDEVIQQEERMFWSRFEDLTICTTLIYLTAVWRQERPRTRLIWLAVLCTMVYFQSENMDLRRSRDHIQKRLGGHMATEHFNIYYPKAWTANRISTLAAELEFLYVEVTQSLEAYPSQPLGIYFYTNMNQKKRLMGARNTRIAKPWQAELHIDAPRIGASVIRHELIHLVAADFGGRPLSIAQNRFGLPNMALTEGLAEAHSPRDPRLSLHEWSAALGKIGKRPNIEALLSSEGFYQSSARTAYTVCGSLLLYAQETHGLAAVKEWYQEGVWRQNPPLSVLLKDWEAYLNAIPLNQHALEATKAYFDRPSIFKRTCAHEMSLLREQIQKALRLRDRQRAFTILDRVLSINAHDRWARLTYLQQLAIDGRLKEASVAAKALGSDPHESQLTRNLGQEWTADLHVLAGDLAAAKTIYGALMENSFDRNVRRRLAVKHASMSRPQIALPIIRLLSFSQHTQQARHRLEDLFRRHSKDPIVGYLKARHLFNHGHLLRAATLFATLQTAGLPKSVQLELSRLRAQLAFNGHCYHLASVGFARHLATFGKQLTAGERSQFEEWRRRSQFFAQSERLSGLTCPLEIDNLYIHPHDDENQE